MKKITPKYDILLLSPPSRSFNHYRPPMALIYLAGYLKHFGLKPKVIDVTEKTVVRDKQFFDNIAVHTQEIEDEILSLVKKNPANIAG